MRLGLKSRLSRVRARGCGSARLAETRDFHSRRGMGARTIAWGRCTPLTIVDQFGIKISGFTPSFEALGHLDVTLNCEV